MICRSFEHLTCKIAVQLSHDNTRIAGITSVDQFNHRGLNLQMIIFLNNQITDHAYYQFTYCI